MLCHTAVRDRLRDCGEAKVPEWPFYVAAHWQPVECILAKRDTLLESTYHTLTSDVKRTLHLNTARINLGALYAHLLLKQILRRTQLIVYKQVHYLTCLPRNVFLACSLSYHARQTLNLIAGKVAPDATFHEHASPPNNPVHGRLVIIALARHRTTKLRKIAAYCFHRTYAQANVRPVLL